MGDGGGGGGGGSLVIVIFAPLLNGGQVCIERTRSFRNTIHTEKPEKGL